MLTLEYVNDVLINGDGLIVTHLDSAIANDEHSSLMFEKLAKTAVVVIVKSGCAEVEIDYKWYKLEEHGNNVVLIGKLNKIGRMKMDKEFRASCLTISRKFVSRIVPYNANNKNIPQLSIPITNLIVMRDNPVFHLQSQEKTLMINLIDRIEINSGRNTALLRLQILYVSVVAFLVELMNIIMTNYSDTRIKDRNRKHDLVQDFSNILLQNFRHEHSVSFYADKLCISAQYLSKSTRNILGVSASKVISDMIATEAAVLLRDPNMSIQQISQDLGFTDQSAFGKFFKKIHGMSPQNYRKNS